MKTEMKSSFMAWTDKLCILKILLKNVIGEHSLTALYIVIEIIYHWLLGLSLQLNIT